MAKVQIDLKAKDKASPKIKGMTGALIGAQLATTAIIAGTKKLVEVGKKAIENFAKQEKAERLLEAQLGRNITGLKQFASEMQGITTVGDETYLELIRLNSAMGVSDERLEQATKNTIALAKGFNIAETTAVKLSAAIESGNTTMLNRYIPALQTAGSEAEKNVIIQEALAKGFKVAEAEAQTFAGRLAQLKNVQGDNLEKFGEFASILGEDIVKSLGDAATGLNEFLNDSDKMSNILGNASAGLAVVRDIFTTLKPVITDVAAILKDDIGEAFADLNGDGGEAVDVFKLLAGATKQLSIGLTVIGASAGTAIQGFVNLVQAAEKSFNAIKTVYDWYNDPDNVSMSDVVDGFKDAGKAFGEFGGELVADAKDIVNDTIEAYKKFPDEVEELSVKMSSTFKQEYDAMVKKVQDGSGEMVGDQKDANSDIEDDTKNTTAEIGSQWEKMYNGIASAAMGAFSNISGAVEEFMQRDIDKVAENLQNNLDAIDAETQATLASLGLIEETRAETLANEVSMLQNSLNKAKSLREKELIRQQLEEKKAALKGEKILETTEAKKEKLRMAAAKKEHALRVIQFNVAKGLKIAEITATAAQGTAAAWAGAAGWPGPSVVAGMAMAGVLTGIIATNQAISTALVASAAPPSFAVGTDSAPGGVALVGERGPEYVTLPSGASVSTANDSEGISSGFPTMVIEQLTVKADDPAQLNEALLEQYRTQLARV